MKKLLKNIQARLQSGKKANAGFSLVELIIVIAIMAILVGIVGTQVLPYLSKSRESKDQQVLSSYATAAVSAYSMLAEEIDTEDDLTIEVFDDTADAYAELRAEIQTLTSYTTYKSLAAAMSSSAGQSLDNIEITFSWSENKVTVIAVSGGEDVGIAAVEATL